jgi:hypothetical protein
MEEISKKIWPFLLVLITSFISLPTSRKSSFSPPALVKSNNSGPNKKGQEKFLALLHQSFLSIFAINGFE